MPPRRRAAREAIPWSTLPFLPTLTLADSGRGSRWLVGGKSVGILRAWCGTPTPSSGTTPRRW
eukprot:11886228-Alexandrium_andersonii.AAC.1